MRHRLTILSLIAALLLPAGCGGGVDSDMDLSEKELKEVIESLSVSELEDRIAEVKERLEAMEEDLKGDEEPSAEEQEELGKLMGLGLAYGIALGMKKGG